MTKAGVRQTGKLGGNGRDWLEICRWNGDPADEQAEVVSMDVVGQQH